MKKHRFYLTHYFLSAKLTAIKVEASVRLLAGSVIEKQNVLAVMAIIATGTPLGVGYAMKRNQRWLKPRELVEIEGIGSGTCPIVNEADIAGRATAA